MNLRVRNAHALQARL